MSNIFTIVIFISIFLIILSSIPYFRTSLSVPNFTKVSPFECGFSPFLNSKTQKKVQFFLIAILFVLFDLEVVMLTPAIYVGDNFTSIYFCIYVYIGLYLE